MPKDPFKISFIKINNGEAQTRINYKDFRSHQLTFKNPLNEKIQEERKTFLSTITNFTGDLCRSVVTIKNRVSICLKFFHGDLDELVITITRILRRIK